MGQLGDKRVDLIFVLLGTALGLLVPYLLQLLLVLELHLAQLFSHKVLQPLLVSCQIETFLTLAILSIADPLRTTLVLLLIILAIGAIAALPKLKLALALVLIEHGTLSHLLLFVLLLFRMSQLP